MEGRAESSLPPFCAVEVYSIELVGGRDTQIDGPVGSDNRFGKIIVVAAADGGIAPFEGTGLPARSP